MATIVLKSNADLEIGEVYLKCGGVLNFVKDEVWDKVHQSYKGFIDERIKLGFIIVGNSKNSEEAQTEEAMAKSEEIGDITDNSTLGALTEKPKSKKSK